MDTSKYEQLLEEAPVEEMDELQAVQHQKAYARRKKRRFHFLLRAVYGEFCCTLVFFVCVYGSIAKCSILHASPWETSLTCSLAASFTAIALIFCYSGVSGAHFNSAISFALWLTGKLSNRKLLLYVIAQLTASILAMGVISLTFSEEGIYNTVAIVPGPDADLWRIFFSEFVCTLILTYTIFHVAFEEKFEQTTQNRQSGRISSFKHEDGFTVYTTNPQSKGAFVPFIFGFVLFGLLSFGGASGAAMNPVRLLAPALFSGKWAGVWVYILGQLAGAAAGATLTHFVERLHFSSPDDDGDDVDAGEDAESDVAGIGSQTGKVKFVTLQ